MLVGNFNCAGACRSISLLAAGILIDCFGAAWVVDEILKVVVAHTLAVEAREAIFDVGGI